MSATRQMIRPFRDEVERYGHYSLAAESMYDHPFQWGSKRTGPDLARVGGRYSDEWHVEHLIHPQSVVPESVMPSYAFLANTAEDRERLGHLIANRRGRRALQRRDDRERRSRPGGPGQSGCGLVGP
jgi:cytochrome c oxidase cbb3-type subunit 2